jgi:hypothetical protein
MSIGAGVCVLIAGAKQIIFARVRSPGGASYCTVSIVTYGRNFSSVFTPMPETRRRSSMDLAAEFYGDAHFYLRTLLVRAFFL